MLECQKLLIEQQKTPVKIAHTDMGPKTKEVILLTLEGKTSTEIAQIMGTQTKAVQDKIKMGIKKIRWALRK